MADSSVSDMWTGYHKKWIIFIWSLENAEWFKWKIILKIDIFLISLCSKRPKYIIGTVFFGIPIVGEAKMWLTRLNLKV